MPDDITVDQFLAVLRKSRLIPDDQLQRQLGELCPPGKASDSARELAFALAGRGVLTGWQVGKLLRGQHEGFWLGDYRLMGLIGEGAMGSVYLAEHALLQRTCAVKVLPAAGIEDASLLPRFIREARAVAALDHPHIVRAYDVDVQVVGDEEIHFLAMEYLQGENLQARIDRLGPLDFREAAEITRQVALGLAHAHQAALVHRDIKPANLLLDGRGVVKILDLGLAKSLQDDEQASLTLAHHENVLGTANYLSPEQAVDSHAVDHRADIYSLGCSTYCMLAGHPPFHQGPPAQRITAHQYEPPPALETARPDAPPDLVEIVNRMMVKQPAERIQTADEVARLMTDWLRRHPVQPVGVAPTAPRPASDTTLHTHSAPAGSGHPSEPAVGIDLGTTYSVIAYLDEGGKPTTVLNEEGDPTTPSAVFFDDSAPVVGKEAVKVAEFEPGRVARFAKRDMGAAAYHDAIGGRQLPPEVVQSLVLRKLKQDARLRSGEFRRVVITVPAYFNEPRRKATQDAGYLAGLDVIDLINEPTAAAIAYGVRHGFLTQQGTAPAREMILVYDLGGGTFDATLMEIDGGNYRALATAGDVFLGGIDWDERIANHVVGRCQQEHGTDLRLDAGARQRLLQESADAKRSLTARDVATVRVAHNGRSLRVQLTRDEFESITADLLDRTRMTLRKLLREAKRSWKDVTRLLLVGGSTRMPMVQRMLEQESGLAVDRSLSPDEAVAHGAALYAGMLLEHGHQRLRGISVRNVNSHDLGVLAVERSTGRSRRRLMIRRNTPLPAAAEGLFRTARDGQRSVLVPVVEGGTDSGAHATQIGQCAVTGLPENLPARTPVTVTFRYAANGRLTVEASLPAAGQRAEITIDRASGLSHADLARWRVSLDEGLRFDQDPAHAAPRHDAPPEKQAPVAPQPPIVVEPQVPGGRSPEDSIAVEDIDCGPARPKAPPPDDTALGDFLKGL